MHRHMIFKFIALALCAACLLAALVSGAAVVAMGVGGLYTQTPQQLLAARYDAVYHTLAWELGRDYTRRTYSNLTQGELSQVEGHISSSREFPGEELWFYRILDAQGRELESRYEEREASGAILRSFQVHRPSYPLALERNYGWDDPSDAPTQPTLEQGATEPTQVPEPTGYYFRDNYYLLDGEGQQYRCLVAFYEGPDLTVELYLLPGAVEAPEHWGWKLVELAYGWRYPLVGLLAGALALFAALVVYLCSVAGRRPGSGEACPGGLSRLPLDLYLAGVLAGAVALGILVSDVIYWPGAVEEPMELILGGLGALGYLWCLLAVGFLYALAAQGKVEGHWWLKHTVLGFLLKKAWQVAKWAVFTLDKGMIRLCKALPGAAKKLWALVTAGALGVGKLLKWVCQGLKKGIKGALSLGKKALELLWRGVCRFFRLLPLTWQWLAAAAVLAVLALLAVFGNKLMTLAAVSGGLALVLYGAHSFGTLLESTKRMGQGDLETKVEEKALVGCFREYAQALNALAGVATEAAKKQMRSERMKAELVTNVSHDLKTPLTSIINYVDLLQQAETQQQREQYLEVLARQSQGMKKLLEDLMELSKASTGNLPLEPVPLDAGEALDQALGEFAEKLQLAELTPVYRRPEKPVMILADSRLTWRVLSNLLGNTVKYALPGTRVYLEVTRQEGWVALSVKNISREQLDVTAEELLERFVRGDASRNTEGSGLGLNIAQSLMELQKGRLELTVDGDLFKATVIYPECS